MKPGITGVWQLSPDREGAAIHENLEYDLYYILSNGVLLDAPRSSILFFTIELVAVAVYDSVRYGGRRTSSVAAPESPLAGAALVSSLQGSSGCYLCRRWTRGSTWGMPASWRACFPAARQMAQRRALRVLAARDNVAVLDRLLDRNGERSDGHGSDVQFVPYEDRSLVQLAVRNADLVITDLPYVRQWAASGSVAVVSPEASAYAIGFRGRLGAACPSRAAGAHVVSGVIQPPSPAMSTGRSCRSLSRTLESGRPRRSLSRLARDAR